MQKIIIQMSFVTDEHLNGCSTRTNGIVLEVSYSRWCSAKHVMYTMSVLVPIKLHWQHFIASPFVLQSSQWQGLSFALSITLLMLYGCKSPRWRDTFMSLSTIRNEANKELIFAETSLSFLDWTKCFQSYKKKMFNRNGQKTDSSIDIFWFY